MAVFTRQDISDQALGGLIDHGPVARQGTPLGLAQLFDAMLTRFEAIAIDDLDAVARKPIGSFTTHVLNKRGKLTCAIAHQLRRCMRLQVVEFVVDRDEVSCYIVLLSLLSGRTEGCTQKTTWFIRS